MAVTEGRKSACCQWLIENGTNTDGIDWVDVMEYAFVGGYVDQLATFLRAGAIFRENLTSNVAFNRILSMSSVLMLVSYQYEQEVHLKTIECRYVQGSHSFACIGKKYF